ncbi:MAG: hypothetical protein M3O35_14885 [Acidobacteriota bacterium]|nr:hypothetical protein [Acidobacteriota bacterium]
MWIGLGSVALNAGPAVASTTDHNSLVALCLAFCIVVGYSWWRSRHV